MNKIQKSQILLAGMIAGIAFSGSALAYPTVNIADNYWGGNYVNPNTLLNQDRVGGLEYEVYSMDVTLTGNILTVQVNTEYAGHAGSSGTGYGDLFLASSWNPFGAAPYGDDDNTNGTNWTYGFSLEGDRYDGTLAGGTGSLFQLNGTNDQNAILSQDVTISGFRADQEVIVDTASGTTTDTGNDGSWTINAGNFISFSIDLAGTDLLNGDVIALKWGMTCANDSIEGQYRLPEPGILMLVSLGLTGFGFAAAARKRKV